MIDGFFNESVSLSSTLLTNRIRPFIFRAELIQFSSGLSLSSKMASLDRVKVLVLGDSGGFISNFLIVAVILRCFLIVKGICSLWETYPRLYPL